LIPPLHPVQMGSNDILLAHALLRQEFRFRHVTAYRC
jgi:hypothetical protein